MIAKGYALLVLLSTPRLDQSVIWRSAMTAYFMPIVGMTWLFILIVYTLEAKSQKFWRYVLIFITALISAGFSETGAAFQGGYLGLMLLGVVILRVRNKNCKVFIFPVVIALLGVVIGVALMYFSPVTAMRRASMPELITINELINLLGLNLKVYFWHSIMRRTVFLILPFLFGLGLGWIYFVLPPNHRDQVLTNLTWRHWSLLIVLVPVVVVLLIACVMLPATYVQVSYPPERALILAQSVLTIGSMVGGVLFVLWVDSIFNFSKTRFLWVQDVLRTMGIILILSVIFSSILMIHKNADKLPFYARWSQLWDARHEELLHAGRTNQDEIHVIELDHVIVDVGELSPDPDYWYNNCAEMYYGIKAIYADLPGW